jgi:hypothetical protein
MKQLHLFDNPPEQLSLFADEQISRPAKPAPKVINFPVKKVKTKPAPKARIEDVIGTMTNDELLAMIRDNPHSVRYCGRA